MVALSKLLNNGLRDAKCYDVFHPGETCSEFQFNHAGSSIIKCITYFFPIVFVPLLIKGKKLRKKHFYDALNYYIDLILTGFLISQTVPVALCAIRGIYGEFTKCNFMYIPMTFPTWPMCFASAKVARLFAASIFQVTLEAALRNSKNSISKILCQSKIIQAVLFMTCSAFILNSVQKYDVKAIWIVKSIPPSSQSDNNSDSDKCTHDLTCSRFCLNDLARNVLIGISVDLFKIFLESIPKGMSFFNHLKKKLFSLNLPTTLFLSSYSCIYRMTSCLLNRTRNSNPLGKHLTAAFLGGMSFFFLPKLTMLCYAITVSIEISWKLLERRKFENKLEFIEMFKKIPFHRIYICLSAGYLVHMYVFRSEVLSPLGLAIVSGLTGNRAPVVKSHIFNYFKSIQ